MRRTFAVSACDRHSSFDGDAFRLRFALGLPGVSIRRLISFEQRGAPAPDTYKSRKLGDAVIHSGQSQKTAECSEWS